MHNKHKYDQDVDPSSLMFLKNSINLKELSLNKAGICELFPMEAIVNLTREIFET